MERQTSQKFALVVFFALVSGLIILIFDSRVSPIVAVLWLSLAAITALIMVLWGRTNDRGSRGAGVGRGESGQVVARWVETGTRAKRPEDAQLVVRFVEARLASWTKEFAVLILLMIMSALSAVAGVLTVAEVGSSPDRYVDYAIAVFGPALLALFAGRLIKASLVVRTKLRKARDVNSL